MNILVTGSSGHIGSFLQLAFNSDGMDLKNKQNLCNGITHKKEPYDVIVHCAAFMRNELNLYENNINSTKKVIEYCEKYKSYLIFLSSASVYGNANILPTPEFADLKPLGDYGKSKVDCENLIAEKLINYTIFRLSNVNSTPDGVCQRFKNGINTIYGDGMQVRDFITLNEVLRVIDWALQVKICKRQIYNLSTGYGVTANQIYSIFGTGKPKYIDKKEEIYISILDRTKIGRAITQNI